jgi:hypothetical protein
MKFVRGLVHAFPTKDQNHSDQRFTVFPFDIARLFPMIESVCESVPPLPPGILNVYSDPLERVIVNAFGGVGTILVIQTPVAQLAPGTHCIP